MTKTPKKKTPKKKMSKKKMSKKKMSKKKMSKKKMSKKKKTTVAFLADQSTIRTLKHLKNYYGLSTRNKLFDIFISASVLEIAGRPENPRWTKSQRAAWLHCLALGDRFAELAIIRAGEELILAMKPSDRLSADDLSTLVAEELARRLGNGNSMELTEIVRKKLGSLLGAEK